MNHIKEEKGDILKTKTKYYVFLLICFFYTFAMCVYYSPEANALTIGKEKELAKEYMTVIKNTGLIIKDPIIANLVKNIGNEITSKLPPQPFNYSFYVLNVSDFNAFAIPGANIFVNRGLITSLDTVDELAGILAHETAHSVNRHIAQLIDKSKIVSIATFAGILAGVLAGSQGEGDFGQALTMGSLAAGQSAMLSYTREHEIEADQKGFDYLLKTGFSPTGLLTGLKKIREADFYGTDDIPDYFKTHPGTKTRIASLEVMLARYPKKLESAQKHTNYNFDMIKYRIIGLYKNSLESEKLFAKLLQKNPDNAAYHYGYALALTKQLKFDKANIHLKKALVIKLFDPLILLEISNIHLHNDEPQKAVNILKGIENDPVVSSAVLYSLGQAQLELGNLEDAKLNLKKIINKPATALPKAYYYIAKIYSKENNPGLKHFYLGHYYFRIKNNKNARTHLIKALETLSDDKKVEEANSILKEIKEISLL
ncbi:MAG: M48 family metalloprotease [Desulfobacterales bacterium]|nr:M48 family metalloprotease [Desulfobacterales bacterium]